MKIGWLLYLSLLLMALGFFTSIAKGKVGGAWGWSMKLRKCWLTHIVCSYSMSVYLENLLYFIFSGWLIICILCRSIPPTTNASLIFSYCSSCWKWDTWLICGKAGCSFLSETLQGICRNWSMAGKDRLWAKNPKAAHIDLPTRSIQVPVKLDSELRTLLWRNSMMWTNCCHVVDITYSNESARVLVACLFWSSFIFNVRGTLHQIQHSTSLVPKQYIWQVWSCSDEQWF